MNPKEHIGMAQELMERAEQESRDGGNELVAAEFLWGAFAHCLITFALNQRLPHDSHGAFQSIATHLDAAQGGNKWRSRFGSSERLHFHFYHGALTAQQLRTHKRAATEGTRELLVMLSAST